MARNETTVKITEYSPPNPQGKGVIGLLLDWDHTQPRGAMAKPAPQLLADYFTSILVLSATFKFKPVVNQEYYLYRLSEEWSLSLISPFEWNSERRQSYVGKCELHPDMTWTISPSDDLADRPAAIAAITSFHEAFVSKLQSDLSLEEMLPTYVAEFPYYQRLFASALSRSLRSSMTIGGQLSIKGFDWLRELPRHPLLQLHTERK